MQALGLIEVVGYPPAVEAADAALKAANVTLLSIAKADAGIMTVEIIGDVGAVTAAVDAGARSAARIGLVRARHVISRVESDLIGKMIPSERIHHEVVKQPEEDVMEESKADVVFQSKADVVSELKADEGMQEPVTDESLEEPPGVLEVTEKKEEKSQTIDFSQEQLNKRSNANLKSLIRSLGIQVTTERLNSMKKQDLIRLLLEYSKEH